MHRFDTSNDLSNLTTQSITISDAYAISGNGLTLNGSGIMLESNTSSFTHIDLPITLGSVQAWTVTSNNELFVEGTITGPDTAGLIKDGYGALELSGNNSYNAKTVVAAGALFVVGSQPNSDVRVDSFGELYGSGTVGAITASGAIKTYETLHSRDVVFDAGSSLVAHFGVTPLEVAGTVNLSGTPVLTVTGPLALVGNHVANLSVGETSTLITATGGVTGTFKGLPDNSTLPLDGWTLRINYQANKAVLTALAPTPGYVTQLYSDLLNRQPDMGGFTFWTDLLDQNKATPSQVALAFVNSPEFRMQEVKEVYQKFLHRDADSIGLSSWTRFLLQGHTVEQLEAQVVASAEYLQRRAGGNTNSFLPTVINDAFDRSITQADRSVSGEDFAGSRGRRVAAEKFFATTEYQQDLVKRDYVRYLLRDADAGGLNLSVAALNNGLRAETLIAAIVGSPEYLARMTNVKLIPL
jgi:autotransporter-associated beta strand protein